MTQTATPSSNLQESARAAAQAARAESRIEQHQQHRARLEAERVAGGGALAELIGEHDADAVELERHGNGWGAELAGLPCFYDPDDDDTDRHTPMAAWRPVGITCSSCNGTMAGPRLRTLADLGAALEQHDTGEPYPHYCRAHPRVRYVTEWVTPAELTAALAELEDYEVAQVVAGPDGRVCALLRRS